MTLTSTATRDDSDYEYSEVEGFKPRNYLGALGVLPNQKCLY